MAKVGKPKVSEADLTSEFAVFEARAAALPEGVNERQERLAILRGLKALRHRVRAALDHDIAMPVLMKIGDTYGRVVAGIEWPEFDHSLPKPAAPGWYGMYPALDSY